MLDKAEELLQAEEKATSNNKYKRWIVTFLGFSIGLILAPLSNYLATSLGLSLYDRSGLDGKLT